MNRLMVNIMFAFIWMFLQGNLHLFAFFEGFFLGFLFLFITRKSTEPTPYFTRFFKVIWFILYFIKEIIVSNLKVAYDVATPGYFMKPAILAIPLDCKTDLEITLFANMITMTPGTWSIDVSDDKKTLYIHAMYVDDVDTFIKDLKNGLERKLLEVMR